MSTKGSGHARWMRWTSLLVLILTAVVVGFAISLSGRDHATAVAVLSMPWFGVPVLAFVVISAWHMYLGLQVVIDDYVHDFAARRVAHVINALAASLIALTGAVALLRLMVG
jgi:succinate dehydrogenase / fumarate reductase, membrane anchor subunit